MFNPAAGESSVAVLTVRDLQAGIQFYQKLGFGVDSETPELAQLSRDLSRLQLRLLGSGRAEAAGAHFSVDNAEALHEELRAVKVLLVETSHRRPWKMREFVVEDPDGNLLHFAENCRDGVYL